MLNYAFQKNPHTAKVHISTQYIAYLYFKFVSTHVLPSQAKLVTSVKKEKSVRLSAHQISPKISIFADKRFSSCFTNQLDTEDRGSDNRACLDFEWSIKGRLWKAIQNPDLSGFQMGFVWYWSQVLKIIFRHILFSISAIF